MTQMLRNADVKQGKNYKLSTLELPFLILMYSLAIYTPPLSFVKIFKMVEELETEKKI